MMNSDDFSNLVAAAQPMLLRYATLQLRNATWAQDVVSEVLLVALEKPQAFSGKSSVRSWLVGILKFKIIDQFRHNKREPLFATTLDESDEANFEQIEALIAHQPCAMWASPSISPDAALQERQFFAVLEACVEHLPEQQGRAFMMREWLELSTEEICKEVGVSSSNLWVLLHRARTRLQVCLNERWFTNPIAKEIA